MGFAMARSAAGGVARSRAAAPTLGSGRRFWRLFLARLFAGLTAIGTIRLTLLSLLHKREASVAPMFTVPMGPSPGEFGAPRGRRLFSGPGVRLARHPSPGLAKPKRQRTRLTVTAARDTSSRSICSSRRWASRARWSISTRDALLLHRIAFNMAPSIARTPPTRSRRQSHTNMQPTLRESVTGSHCLIFSLGGGFSTFWRNGAALHGTPGAPVMCYAEGTGAGEMALQRASPRVWQRLR